MQKSKLSIILFAGIALAFCAMSAYAVPPKVTKTIPENGDQNVDPGLRRIRIEFDQVMSQDGYSVCGGGPNFPKMIGKPKWINKRTLLMRVKLQPSHEYELSVNCQSYRNFKNLQGESAVVYPIKFKTTTASEKSGTTIKSPSLLLQEGLYAEEVEGNLDAAIEIYQKAVKHAARVEKTAARATYRIGMCYLKKGEKETAADYFEQITTKFSRQKGLAAKAQKELEKLRPLVNLKSTLGEVIERTLSLEPGGINVIDLDSDRVFHYEGSDNLDRNIAWFAERGFDAMAEGSSEGLSYTDMVVIPTQPANWNTKMSPGVGDILRKRSPTLGKMSYSEDLQSTYYYRTREGGIGILQILNFQPNVKFRYKMLQEVESETKESIFEQIDYQVIRFLGEQFGKTALEAGQLHLSVNSHIYYVDREGFSYQGGMNVFYNWTGRTITKKVRFGGTSYPNQTHYGVDGNKLNTEIVPDKTRANHWQIYWIPDEPLAPEEYLYYGWSMNNKRKLSKLPGDVYSLTMDNKFGQPVIETFFLVLPKDLKISKSNSPTASQELENFTVYWWTKQVQQGKNHTERVQLEKAEIGYTSDPVIVRKAVLTDNSGLDLDTGKTGQAPAGLDVAWDNDGGGALMVMPDSNVKLMPVRGIEQKQEDVLSKARLHLPILKTSPLRGISAKENRIVSVLTSEGKLAVVWIEDYSSEKASLRWLLEEIPARKPGPIYLHNCRTVSSEEDKTCLDLVTDDLLTTNQLGYEIGEHRIIRGDLVYDGRLACMRGTKAKLRTDAGLADLKILREDQQSKSTVYEIPDAPFGLEVTIPEGDKYDVKILSATGSGLTLEYKKIQTTAKDKHAQRVAENRAQMERDIRTIQKFDKSKAVSAKDKRSSENLSANGWQLWGQRKLAEAEKVFKRAVVKDPTNANAWNGLGWSQFNQGKNLNAKHSFEKCLEIEPKHAAALNGLGWIAKAQGKTDEAIGHWEKAIKAAPTATASLNGLATTYMERKDYDKAVKYYRMWLDTEPKNADAKAGLDKAKAAKK
ncbi:MAG: tetratricopeptide repeat protein [Planctomycetota bacterium]|jgi:tetratricopeptide (TPR) repeat protein